MAMPAYNFPLLQLFNIATNAGKGYLAGQADKDSKELQREQIQSSRDYRTAQLQNSAAALAETQRNHNLLDSDRDARLGQQLTLAQQAKRDRFIRDGYDVDTATQMAGIPARAEPAMPPVPIPTGDTQAVPPYVQASLTPTQPAQSPDTGVSAALQEMSSSSNPPVPPMGNLTPQANAAPGFYQGTPTDPFTGLPYGQQPAGSVIKQRVMANIANNDAAINGYKLQQAQFTPGSPNWHRLQASIDAAQRDSAAAMNTYNSTSKGDEQMLHDLDQSVTAEANQKGVDPVTLTNMMRNYADRTGLQYNAQRQPYNFGLSSVDYKSFVDSVKAGNPIWKGKTIEQVTNGSLPYHKRDGSIGFVDPRGMLEEKAFVPPSQASIANIANTNSMSQYRNDMDTYLKDHKIALTDAQKNEVLATTELIKDGKLPEAKARAAKLALENDWFVPLTQSLIGSRDASSAFRGLGLDRTLSQTKQSNLVALTKIGNILTLPRVTSDLDIAKFGSVNKGSAYYPDPTNPGQFIFIKPDQLRNYANEQQSRSQGNTQIDRQLNAIRDMGGLADGQPPAATAGPKPSKADIMARLKALGYKVR